MGVTSLKMKDATSRLAPSGTLGPASANVHHGAVKDSGPGKENATVACLESPGAPETTSNLLSAIMRYLNIYTWLFIANKSNFILLYFEQSFKSIFIYSHIFLLCYQN